MDSELINIIILAILQGVTEFLPVSSSGHLVICQHLLGISEGNLTSVIVLHAGTLCSIILFYVQDLLRLTRTENRRTIGMIIVGSIPVVIVGFLILPIFELYFESLWVVAAGLFTTAALLLLVHSREAGTKTMLDMTIRDAVIIGILQSIAVVPGISRSGSTISIATRLRYSHATAARFSFYLAIPAIFGANLLKAIDLLRAPQDAAPSGPSIAILFIGFLVAFAVGYFALKLLIRTLENRTFSHFGYYCLLLACGLSTYYIMLVK